MTQVDITLTPDSEVDQSDSAQAQLTAAGNGTPGNELIINMPAGRYRIDKGLSFNVRHDIRWTCLSGRFEAYTDLFAEDIGLTSRSHFVISGSVNVIGSNFDLEGPNILRETDPNFAKYVASRESDHGFRIQSTNATISEDCGFEDCTYFNVCGDGFSIGGTNVGTTNTNQDIHFTDCSGTYAGRHGLNVSDCDGFTGTNVTVDNNGRAGMDIEPNGVYQRAWNITLDNVAVGGRLKQFVFSGSGSNGAQVRKRNITMTDCTALRNGNLPGLQVSSAAPAGNDGFFVLERYTDLQSNKLKGVVISNFDDVTVKDSRISKAGQTGDSYAIQVHCRNSLTITGNDCNGRPGTAGFDHLYLLVTTIPTTFVHGGNVWAMGTQNDGPTPEIDPDPPLAPPLGVAFQVDAFQVDTFQALISAFQTNAFQDDAFQAPVIPALQSDFVQTNAFQAGPFFDTTQVQNLVATPVSPTQIDLVWEPFPSLADGYDIERDGVVIVGFHPTHTYSDTSLDPETEYTYRVRAVELV